MHDEDEQTPPPDVDVLTADALALAAAMQPPKLLRPPAPALHIPPALDAETHPQLH